MANELTVTVTANLTNGLSQESFGPGAVRIDQAAIGSHGSTVSVGQAAEENLATGDISTLGWLFLHNLDSTNFVTYGPDNGGSMVALGRLEPGEVAALRLEPGITFRWQADTADVLVKALLLED